MTRCPDALAAQAATPRCDAVKPRALDRVWARRLSAALIPHATSVHNVDLIAAAIACARHDEHVRTERLVAAMREAGETAFKAMVELSGSIKEDHFDAAYRQIVARLMAQHCREHGEDEIAKTFEREDG